MVVDGEAGSGTNGVAQVPRVMVMQRPSGVGVFQFVVLASLRAAQLMRGCRPRIEGVHKNTVMAQLEVSQGKVLQLFGPPPDVIGGSALIAAVPVGDVMAAVQRV